MVSLEACRFVSNALNAQDELDHAWEREAFANSKSKRESRPCLVPQAGGKRERELLACASFRGPMGLTLAFGSQGLSPLSHGLSSYAPYLSHVGAMHA